MPYKIAIIEDDPIIGEELTTLLKNNGYLAEMVTDFTNLAEQIKHKQPQLILLDILLPETSGFAICAQIRTFSTAPIIFVTGCHTDMDELNSILLGGDAFMTKPYNPAILLAKIDSLLKRAYHLEQGETLTFQEVALQLASSSLVYHGAQVELTKNEVKILYYLFTHSQRICTREELIDYLWDNRLYIDDNALSVHINRIREKLARIGLKDLIKTKHRQGYTL